MHHDDHDHDVHRDHDDLGNHRKGEGDSAPSALTISKCENVDPFVSLKFDSLILKIQFIPLWRVYKWISHTLYVVANDHLEGPASCKWLSRGELGNLVVWWRWGGQWVKNPFFYIFPIETYDSIEMFDPMRSLGFANFTLTELSNLSLFLKPSEEKDKKNISPFSDFSEISWEVKWQRKVRRMERWQRMRAKVGALTILKWQRKEEIIVGSDLSDVDTKYCRNLL